MTSEEISKASALFVCHSEVMGSTVLDPPHAQAEWLREIAYQLARRNEIAVSAMALSPEEMERVERGQILRCSFCGKRVENMLHVQSGGSCICVRCAHTFHHQWHYFRRNQT